MLERGYEKRTAMGPLMAAGGIAMLIPPSALAVLLGSLAEISIEKLLIGGIVPGIMMAVFFLAYIIIHCLKNPDVAPVYQTAKLTRAQRWKPFLVDVLPLFAIFAVVVGSMLKGWASPTEASALGAISCFIAAAAYRALTFDNFRKSLLETAKVSVMILFILVASSTFSLLLSFSGATSGLLEALSTIRLTPLQTVIGMIVILLILGCFVDQVSMIMLTLPFFMPIAQSMGIDTVWLGLLILISMEIGFITPPFGMLLIVMQGVAPSGTRFVDVYRAAYPYLLIEILVLGLLMAFPQLATSLPNLVGTL
jgi:tripartite ATP-independent transporter DctM subunit